VNPTIKQIQTAVCARYGLTEAQLLGEQRGRYVAWPRQMAMYLCLSLTYNHLPKIAAAFNRDHTTVMHGRDAMMKRLRENPDVLEDYNVLTKGLLNGAKPPALPRLISKPVPKRKRRPKKAATPPKKKRQNKHISKPSLPPTMQRKCLDCGSMFKSHGPGNRLCKPCGRQDHDVLGVAA